ncbi:hypothetical protein LTR84_000188 [Exophiala bonariae]|uniref:Xylanolytic transcriptional activator regulatory domain-containing protein n=1 Tax=Exophiala bonariae TaxID=1690606 RepID=A0AAV9NSH5_9EURO|nr:hypothetical protein LTR84_000188 [Exophiala bonariae]
MTSPHDDNANDRLDTLPQTEPTDRLVDKLHPDSLHVSANTRPFPDLVQHQPEKDHPAADFSLPCQPPTSNQIPADGHGTGGLADLDLYTTDFTFLNEVILPNDHMVNFFPTEPGSDSNPWEMFSPSALLKSPSDPQQSHGRPAASRPQNRSSPSGSDNHSEQPFHVDDEQYAEAQCNLMRFDHSHRLGDFQLPSKYAVARFLKAFFEHMAPHLPIIHRPSFDIATVPSQLLLSTMACGAIYSSEQETALQLYAAAAQLMAENEIHISSTSEDGAFQLWELQTSILLSYFSAYSGIAHMRRKAYSTFARTTRLAQEAVDELESDESSDYMSWVRQESISRCVASVNILGAAMNSTSEDQNFQLPDYQTKIRLPSRTADWLRDEQVWEGPPPALYSSDLVTGIFAGIRPEIAADDYAFLTLVSAALGHICSFQNLTLTKHPDLHATFIDQMSTPLALLDTMWEEQVTDGPANGSLPTPLTQCTRSLLDSACYHLYGSAQLVSMTRLLKSPGLLDDPQKLHHLSSLAQTKTLELALVRAATSLRIDCRLGLRYVQKVAPHRFAPLSATAVAEGGLLLYWYLRFQQVKIVEVDLLLNEVNSEVKNLQSYSRKAQYGNGLRP